MARKAFVGLSWLFVALVLLQFFFAGLGSISGRSWEPHIGFGYSVLYFFPILITIAAYFSKASQRVLVMCVALVFLMLVQPVWITGFRDSPVAALHVLGSGLILALGHELARKATALNRESVRV